MPRTDTIAAFLLLTLTGTVSTTAQSLDKRHQLELRVGGWSQVTDTRTSIGIGGVTTTVASNGFIGGFAYGHWLQEELAFRISAGLMAANIDVQTSTAGVTTDFAAIVPLQFGLRYFFPKSTYGKQFRPFVGGSVGTIVGRQESVQTGVTVATESRAETAFGGEFEAGVGILLGRNVLATVATAYNLMTDFEEPIGGSRNYSGPQMTLGISLLLGGGPGGS